MKNIPFTERCRPAKLDEIVMTVKNRRLLEPQFSGAKDIQNMVFYGKSGCGKTTTARLFGSLPRFSDRVKVINASNDLVTRQDLSQITEFLNRQGNGLADALESGSSPYRLVVLEEADELTPRMVAALRGYIEDNYGKGRFILTMNSLKKMTPALISRFTMVDFSVAGLDSTPEFASHIDRISKLLAKTGMKLDRATIDEICRSNFPDFRKMECEVESAAMP